MYVGVITNCLSTLKSLELVKKVVLHIFPGTRSFLDVQSSTNHTFQGNKEEGDGGNEVVLRKNEWMTNLLKKYGKEANEV